MTVREIKDIFKEYGIGVASMSDVQLIYLAVGFDFRPGIEVRGLELESRPMFIASMYRKILVGMGFATEDISRLLPPEASGPVTMSDLQLGVVKFGSDYVGPDGTTIIPGLIPPIA